MRARPQDSHGAVLRRHGLDRPGRAARPGVAPHRHRPLLPGDARGDRAPRRHRREVHRRRGHGPLRCTACARGRRAASRTRCGGHARAGRRAQRGARAGARRPPPGAHRRQHRRGGHGRRDGGRHARDRRRGQRGRAAATGRGAGRDPHRDRDPRAREGRCASQARGAASRSRGSAPTWPRGGWTRSTPAHPASPGGWTRRSSTARSSCARSSMRSMRRLRRASAGSSRCSAPRGSASRASPASCSWTLGERASALTGRCLPYGEGITFWPIARDRPLSSAARTRSSASVADAAPDAIADRVRRAVGSEPAAIAAAESFWAAPPAPRGARARCGRSSSCVEDVHWAEPTLLDLVEYVARPEPGRARSSSSASRGPSSSSCGRPGWRRGNAPTSSCSSRSRRRGRRRSRRRPARRRRAPGATRRRIADAAEGNPLFVEQIVGARVRGRSGRAGRGAADDPGAARRAARPARADERAVIERAAVVGREFTLGQLVHLTEDELRPAVTGSLLSLARKGLLAPGGEEGTDDDGCALPLPPRAHPRRGVRRRCRAS